MSDSRLALAIATTILLFASAFPTVKLALVAYDPGPLALLRFAVASVASAVYVVIRRPRLPQGKDLPRTAVVGLLGVSLYHVIFNVGQRTVSASAGSILVNTGPVWTALLAMWLLDERPRATLWIGLVVSVVGAALVAVGERGPLAFSVGAVLVLAAAMLQAASFVIQKPIVGRSSAAGVIALSIWFGTALLLVVFGRATLVEVSRADIGPTAAAIYLGLAPGGIALVAWAYVLGRLPASRAGPFLLLVPLCATALARIGVHEIPGSLTLVGGALSVGGVGLTFRRS